MATSAAESVYSGVGVRRGVAEVSRKWRNFGCAGSGSRTGAGETVCKSLHLDKSSDRGLNSEHFLWGKKEIPVKSTRALAGISVLLVLLLSVSGCGGAGTALATPPHSTVTSDIKATQQSSTTVTLSPVSLFFGTQLLATPSTAKRCSPHQLWHKRCDDQQHYSCRGEQRRLWRQSQLPNLSQHARGRQRLHTPDHLHAADCRATQVLHQHQR